METIDHIIETGESKTLIQRAIQDQGRGHIIEAIKEIHERHIIASNLYGHECSC